MFSCRKHRSLPDLSVLTQHDDLKQDMKLAAQLRNKSDDVESDKSSEQKSDLESENEEEKGKPNENGVSLGPVFDAANDALSDSEFDQQRFRSVSFNCFCILEWIFKSKIFAFLAQ